MENIDIDMVILENIDKAILQNIDIDKISNRFKFGISNRASVHAYRIEEEHALCHGAWRYHDLVCTHFW